MEVGRISSEHDGVGEIIVIHALHGQVSKLLDGVAGNLRSMERLLVPDVALVPS